MFLQKNIFYCFTGFQGLGKKLEEQSPQFDHARYREMASKHSKHKTPPVWFFVKKKIEYGPSARYFNGLKSNKSNLHYTHDITPKQVTSGGAHLRALAPGLRNSEETSQRWRVVGDSVSDLTGPGFAPQTSRTDSDVWTTELPGRNVGYWFTGKFL